MRKFFFALVFSSLLAIGFHFGSAPSADAQSVAKLNLGEPLPANIFIELAKMMNPSVVNISTSTAPPPGLRGRSMDPFSNMFEQFLGPQGGHMVPRQGLGTGFVIRSDGLILTNNHVIEGADVVKVQLSENDRVLYTAEVIGKDRRTDLALIKIDAKKNLPAAKLGVSKNLQVGEWVAAFGNPLGLGHTTSKGIISAIGREIGELNRIPFLQTDASINPGNSGGPLVNMKGEVIGVNTAIAANSQGIGFAIPIDEAKSVIAVLEKDGVIKRGYLGVNMYPYPIHPQAAQEMNLPRTNGMLIVSVMPKSPAAKAGLKEYDFITKFNGHDVDSPEDFSRLIADAEVGKNYKIEYVRKGKTHTVTAQLEEHPEDKNQVQAKKKTYQGQSAPYDLGFTVANYTSQLARDLRLPALRQPYPVVIEVDYDRPAGRAGLSVGDIIIDVNREEVTNAVDVFKNLKGNQINSLRILRGQRPTLIYINPK